MRCWHHEHVSLRASGVFLRGCRGMCLEWNSRNVPSCPLTQVSLGQCQEIVFFGCRFLHCPFCVVLWQHKPIHLLGKSCLSACFRKQLSEARVWLEAAAAARQDHHSSRTSKIDRFFNCLAAKANKKTVKAGLLNSFAMKYALSR